MNYIYKIAVLFYILGLSLAAQEKYFNLDDLNQEKTVISLIPEKTTLESHNGFSKFTGKHMGRTNELGLPELPIYSTFFAMKPNTQYEVSYSVKEKYTISDVKLLPSQPLTQRGSSKPPFKFDEEYYKTASQYPNKQIGMGEPIIMRNMEMFQLSFTPYKYNPSTQTLEVYTKVEIEVNEAGHRSDEPPTITKKSRLFEELFEDIVINYMPSSNPEDYQTPSILYICGGSSANDNDIQELVDWRHKQGYEVRVATESTVGGSSASESEIYSYINELYNSANPPEIVGLIGDTGGNYSLPAGTHNWGSGGWYGYQGATDINYTLLDGNDLVPDIFIGRLSVNSGSEIAELVAKTLAYEKATYISSTGTDWYEGAALAGDPDESGNSTIITNQYIENMMTNYGMENIMTDYDGSGVQTFMENSFQEGILYYNYRGWYGGYGSYPTSSLNNGWMTPFVTTITCGTGDFNGTSSSEAFVREGSANNPEGAVAAIGVATTGTHTAYNNIVDMGVYEGIYSLELSTAGAANHYGDIALLETYPSNPSDAAFTFMAWSNLIGDPALHLWTDTPKSLSPVLETNEIHLGTTALSLRVDDDSGAVEGAKVTLLQGNDDIFTSGYTDEAGNVTLTWSSNSAADINMTITKRNYIPHEGVISVNDDIALAVGAATVSNDANGDGQLNPGETASLSIPIANIGANGTSNISAELVSNSSLVEISDASSFYGSIASNESSFGDGFLISVNDSAIDMENLELYLQITDGSSSWISQVPLDIFGASVVVNYYDIIGTNFVVVGSENNINLNISNLGSKELNNLSASLSANGYDISISDGNAELNSLAPGEASNIGPFSIIPSDDIIGGSDAVLEINFIDSSGYNRSNFFTLPMGRQGVTDPLGPDVYGYYIYDSGDLYDLAPEYNWIEIADGTGTDLNMSDPGNGDFTMYDDGSNSSTTTVDLPFPVKFYGIDYDRVTICTNGFITFGDSDVASFRNYSIPGAGGPSPMVAAFWDDLRTGSGGDVHYYEDDSKVIIQWDDMRTYYNSSYRQTFEIIIYSLEEVPTVTGDNEIVIQYQDYNNVSSGSYPEANTPIHGCYSTIGIENQFGNDGLQYSFNGYYSTSSMEIEDGSAIRITTGRVVDDIFLGDINSDGILNILDIVTLVNIVLSN